MSAISPNHSRQSCRAELRHRDRQRQSPSLGGVRGRARPDDARGRHHRRERAGTLRDAGDREPGPRGDRRGVDRGSARRNEQIDRGGHRLVAGISGTGGRPKDRSSWPSAAAWWAIWPASSPRLSPAGLRFFQVPTSLLAQVDSSVGGKVGINLPEAKNMVGAFHQPAGVLIDTATLATLPANEYRSGLAEVVKYGVILDAEFFAYLEAHAAEINARQEDVLAHVIARCCRLKADVVRARRARRDGPAGGVELRPHVRPRLRIARAATASCCTAKAVAIGMCCAARLAQRLGRVDAKFVERQQKLLESFGLPIAVPNIDREKILEAMQHDKKVQHGNLKFVLPEPDGTRGIGGRNRLERSDRVAGKQWQPAIADDRMSRPWDRLSANPACVLTLISSSRRSLGRPQGSDHHQNGRRENVGIAGEPAERPDLG